MKDKKSMAMIIIVGIVIVLFLCVNTTVFATTGTVVGDNVRLRKEESTSSKILDLLEQNDKVEILGESGDWYKVKVNGNVGYISKQYIKVKDENNTNNKQEPSNDKNTENNQPAQNENQNTENNKPAENPVVDENGAQNNEDKTTEQNNAEENKTEIPEAPKSVKFSADTELKVLPLINGAVINVANNSETYDVICSAGLWSYVKYGNKSGWVLTEKTVASTTEVTAPNPNPVTETKPEQKPQVSSTEKLYSKAKTYYVKGSSVNVRSAASKSASVVKVLNTNNSVKVIGEDDTWYIIELNGGKAYVAKSLLSTEKVEVTSRNSNSVSATQTNAAAPVQQAPVQEAPATPVASNPSGDAIVAYAKTFLGYQYVYGTNGPNTFDCSGFVQYVYKHFGYSLSRSSGTQANDGVAVSKSNLQPGDVLIFRDTSNTRIGHVGIYIGGDQFIHASNSKTGVIISSLSSASYQKRYVGARRILK